jgi:hypothetical protein
LLADQPPTLPCGNLPLIPTKEREILGVLGHA